MKKTGEEERQEEGQSALVSSTRRTNSRKTTPSFVIKRRDDNVREWRESMHRIANENDLAAVRNPLVGRGRLRNGPVEASVSAPHTLISCLDSIVCEEERESERRRTF